MTDSSHQNHVDGSSHRKVFLMRVVLQCGLSFFLIASSAIGADYLRDVKPLLEHKCYACHGSLKQLGGLRLDTAEDLIKGGDSGTTLTAGQLTDSLLLDVLTGDAGFQMPPANEGSPLTDDEIQLIRDWISSGAPVPDDEEPQADPRAWWSYQPNRRPPLPELKNPGWCRSDIDYFVAGPREKQALPVVAEATKEAWLRRVYIDLIGLPPTRDELHRFLSDNSPSAYETVVDELLSRPQHGERWARHWMDVWRYSDWYGSRGSNEIRYSQRHIWRWRDWIVSSLNEDKGYDQMVREMLSADEHSEVDQSRLSATGYLGRNWYKFDRDVWMFDTVERTGEAFLGLTLRCCRCHDHKFDPVTQEEYYRFRAFFEPHDVRTDPVSAFTTTQKDATLGQVLNDGVALVYDKNVDAPTYLFERGDSRYPDETKPLAPGVPAALGGTVNVTPVDLPTETWFPMLRPEVRETVLAKAKADVADATEKVAKAQKTAAEAAQKLAAASHASESPASASDPTVVLHDDFSAARPDVWETVNGTWQYENGKLVQRAVTSFATMATTTKLPADVHIHLRYRTLTPGTYRSVGFSFDYQDKGHSQDVYTSTGDNAQSVQAFHRTGGKQLYPKAGIVPTSLTVGEETVLDVSVEGSALTIDLNGKRELEYVMPLQRKDGRFALWVHNGAAEFLELRITQKPESVETLARELRDAEHGLAVAMAERDLVEAEANSIRKRLAADVAAHLDGDEESAAELAREALEAERAVAVFRAKVDVVSAGDDQKKQAAAQQALMAAQETAKDLEGSYTPVGEQFPKTSTGRRSALAAWITSDDNPRTARVAANHIWTRHFGQPLVGTPENFGLNGNKPTHPELLDFLASELISSGWSMKSLHRKIVLSATYRMSSGSDGESTAVDTARKIDPNNRYLWRMHSKRMEAEVVRDAALHLSNRLNATMGGPEIPETDGEKVPRRSLYFRNTPNEKMAMLEVFDVADPNGCYRRKESVVPHQSLAMMNSGLTLDCARTVAEQLEEADDFITSAFETVLCRKPTPTEITRCQTFLAEHSKLLDSATAEPFSTGGSSVRAAAQDSTVRARENLVHVLFLHNDFVTIR